EAGELQRAARLGTLAHIVDQRLHLSAERPGAEESMPDSLASVLAGADSFPNLVHVVEPALEGQHVESHLLVQETDQSRLGAERRAVAVYLLAEHDDARVTDRLAERFQVLELVVVEVDRVELMCVLLEPGDAARAYLRIEWNVFGILRSPRPSQQLRGIEAEQRSRPGKGRTRAGDRKGRSARKEQTSVQHCYLLRWLAKLFGERARPHGGREHHGVQNLAPVRQHVRVP